MQGGESEGAGRQGEPAAYDGTAIAGPTGQQMVVKVSGGASRDAYSLIEYQHAPGAAGPPPHLHREHEEAFYVLDGELTLTVGSATVTLSAGQSAVVPRGVVHQPRNTSSGPVRFLFLNSPPMDRFFVVLSALVADAGGQPPAERLRELGEQYDSIFVDLPTAGPVSMHNEHPQQ
jgi:mannose-6-phosphate isomerase-like protein (cupin superfamily)